MKKEGEAIPGYAVVELGSSKDNWSESEWADEFLRTRQSIGSFIFARDPYVVISKTAMRHITEIGQPSTPQLAKIEQPEVEFLQALFLTRSHEVKSVPTSPGNFVELFAKVGDGMKG
jgi:hypothetical protein